MKRIFISHSSKDKVIIDDFIDVILNNGLGVEVDDIFCTSSVGMKIKSGEDWRNSIKEHLDSAKITFLIITPNYKESEVCQNEMGAAWLSKSLVIPLIIDPIDYKSVGIIQEPKQLEKLLEEESLDRVRDQIKSKLSISSKKMPSDRWSIKKAEFIVKANFHIDENPFLPPLGRPEYDDILIEKKTLRDMYKESIQEITKLKSKVEKLKEAKDKEEVNEIENEFSDNTSYDRFKDLCSDVSSYLKPFEGIVAGIIFNEYSGKHMPLTIGKEYDADIANAIANDYIFDEYQVNTDTTKTIKDLYKALDELQKFMSEYEDDLKDQYEEENKSPFSINNLLFWQDNFSQRIYLD